MNDNVLNSDSCKKEKVDTRNNWVMMMFVTKCWFDCFRKQSHIDTCVEAFREFERFGFVFGEIGFGGGARRNGGHRGPRPLSHSARLFHKTFFKFAEIIVSLFSDIIAF